MKILLDITKALVPLITAFEITLSGQWTVLLYDYPLKGAIDKKINEITVL